MTDINSDVESLLDMLTELTGVSRESLLMAPPVLRQLSSDVLCGAQSDEFLEGRVACTLGWRVSHDKSGNPQGFYHPDDPSTIIETAPAWCQDEEIARTLRLIGWSSSEIREGSQWKVDVWLGAVRPSQTISVVSDSLPRAIVGAWLLARITE